MAPRSLYRPCSLSSSGYFGPVSIFSEQPQKQSERAAVKTEVGNIKHTSYQELPPRTGIERSVPVSAITFRWSGTKDSDYSAHITKGNRSGATVNRYRQPGAL